MKKARVFLLVLLIMLISSSVFTSPGSHNANWQYINHPILEIGVRDKYGNFTNVNYTANFIVYDPNGKAYYYTTHGISDGLVVSRIPNDYKGLFLTPGVYSWQCYVADEIVASGGFRVSRDGYKETISTL